MRKRKQKDKIRNQGNREQKSISKINKTKGSSLKRLIRQQTSDKTEKDKSRRVNT